MDERQLAQGLAAGRVAIGASLVIAPQLLGRLWLGPDGERPGVQVMGRAMGARDLVLGLGALNALRNDAPAREWLAAAAVADLVDAAATLLARDELPTATRTIAVGAAVSAAAFGGVSASRID